MKLLVKITLSFMLIVGFSACNFLNKKPHELTPDTYFNNETELNSFLTGVYSPLGQEPFYQNHFPVYNAGGDDLSFFQRSNPHESIICANANSSNAYITGFWRLLYEGINRANTLLENADKNPAIAESFRKRVKAEAIFLRSFYYFHLVQGWGDVPLKLTATNNVDGQGSPRTDKQIIYDQIIADIIGAIPKLRSANDVNPGYITQSAAKGILARIYLFRAGEHFRDNETTDAEKVKHYFTEAGKWALEVRKSDIHGLVPDYSRVFIDLCKDQYNSTGIKESIWEAEHAGNRISDPAWSAGRIGNVIGFGSSVDHSSNTVINSIKGMKNPGYSYRFIFASTKLYDMYAAHSDSVRERWNIAPYDYTFARETPREVTGITYYHGKKPAGLTSVDGLPVTELTADKSQNHVRCAAKYRRDQEEITPKNKNYTPINFPILRYSDILLMIAEAENEINGAPTDLAYDCLNEVRKRAKVATYTKGSLTQETFRQAVKDERAMELCFEAIRRWDLIRWGEFYSAMQDMRDVVKQNKAWGGGFKYAADYYNISKHYNYYPIPSLEMSVNKSITTNNTGW